MIETKERELSPEFDDFDYEEILQWANAKVKKDYSDYILTWKHGFITFEFDEEEKAKKAAALFIYLWSRGIYAGVADKCAKAYVKMK